MAIFVLDFPAMFCKFEEPIQNLVFSSLIVKGFSNA